MYSWGPVEVVDFDDEDARTAGQVRATLEAAGTPIGAYDVLIAGQAVRRGSTLVTPTQVNSLGCTALPGRTGQTDLG
ncbi:MAG TPA: PIN domain-containing protein [Candidatus Dormibacteraeota bacterium]|nr:PIN domain-containing protein [Candidatus Dormibacteraeota bacterium]